MKTFNLLALAAAFISTGSVYADFPEFEPIGKCVGEESADSRATMVLLSEALEGGKTADGVIVIEIESDGKRDYLGAYKTKYTLSEDEKTLTAVAGGETMQIPVGKNKVVTDPNGAKATCTTKI